MKNGRLKRVMARLVVLLVAICGPALVTAAPAKAEYHSVNVLPTDLFNFAYNQKCNLWRFEAINDVQMSINNRTPWLILDGPPNGHIIAVDGSCLDSNSAGGVYLMKCSSGVNMHQRWHFNSKGRRQIIDGGHYDYNYEIINTATGRCLDANASDAYTQPCNNGDHQRWARGPSSARRAGSAGPPATRSAATPARTSTSK
ncbi:RICIN domain-containing protein [Micromonospora sp. CA-111912]|uniref:RICIN domain-containing protein n=1 Tax=Micromonospora sp. CA-111912 TaxID=3239955 RepID=UPI003D920B5E